MGFRQQASRCLTPGDWADAALWTASDPTRCDIVAHWVPGTPDTVAWRASCGLNSGVVTTGTLHFHGDVAEGDITLTSGTLALRGSVQGHREGTCSVGEMSAAH